MANPSETEHLSKVGESWEKRLNGPECEHFNWLRRASRGPTFTSYSQFEHFPSCSFDWGADGYAGCCNHGGELLYLSAPNPKHGLIMARGNFSTSLYAAMSRAQIDFGGPSTFGLEVSHSDFAYNEHGVEITRENEPDHKNELGAKNGSSFRLGAMIDRGSFNYRWPLTEYYLDLHPNQDAVQRQKKKDAEGKEDAEQDTNNEPQDKHVGTCQMFSCAMNKMFYQVLRIEEGGHFGHGHRSSKCRHFPVESQLIITMGGPVWFQTFREPEDHLISKEGQKRTSVMAPSFSETINRPSPGRLQKIAEDTAKEMPEDIPRKTAEEAEEEQEQEEETEGESNEEIGGGTDQVIDVFENETSCKTIRFWDKGRKVGLEAKLYALKPDGSYEELEMKKSYTDKDSGPPDVQGKSRVTAYNSTYKFDRLMNKSQVHHEHRFATILTAIRLFHDERNGGGEWPKPPPSKELYDYVGVNPRNEMATSAMWENIFVELRQKSRSVLDLAEFCMIGRSLEKILQVDIIPATFKNEKNVEVEEEEEEDEDVDKEKKEGKEEKEERDNFKSAALVSNLFLQASVDLRTLFWKIRFLVRTYQFLFRFRESHGLLSPDREKKVQSIHEFDTECMPHILKFQQLRIKRQIKKVVRYLVKALLGPKWLRSTNLMPYHDVPGDSNYYYVMTTIWYVTKNFPDWKWTWKSSIKDRDHGNLSDPSRLPSDHWTFEPADKDKVQLLQWYHYGSILKLCEQRILPTTWQDNDHEGKVSRLSKAAKILSAAKLSSMQDYVPDEETFDRLCFVSDELGLEDVKHDSIGAVAALSMKRIKQRDHTRSLNPGWLPRPAEGSTSGPWEIHALCHHSRLVVLMMEEYWRAKDDTKEEAELYKQRIRSFLNAEGTILPCWERAHTKARRSWLGSEATAIVSSTFITILEAIMTRDSSNLGSVTDSNYDSAVDARSDQPSTKQPPSKQDFPEQKLALVVQDQATQARQHHKKLLQEFLHVEGLLKDQLEIFGKFTNESGRLRPIQWMKFRPPRRYHPVSFFNSLEDTSDLYKPPFDGRISVPLSLDGYVRLPPTMDLNKKEFKKQDIDEVMHMKSLFLFDIKAIKSDEDAEGFIWQVEPLKYDDSNEKKKKKSSDDLSWALFDSLVDQEVQHRYLMVRKGVTELDPQNPASEKANQSVPREVLELLIYVIHPESAACLGNHVLKFSRFSCQRRDTWVASITLRSWRVDNKPIEQADEQSTSQPRPSPDDEYIRLPMNLKEVWKRVDRVEEAWIFELEVSSIVLSTNDFGDFSQCTVVSELIDEEGMSDIVDDARKLWQKFIHQPQTARCLVFFLLLGGMCQRITQNYEDAIEKLTRILKLDTSFTNTEEALSNDNNYLEFKLGVWSLESLYKLHDSLNSTVSSLLKAKEELMVQIVDGPGKRSVFLERMCNEYVGEFENNLVQLAAVNARLERRIELNTRYKDATSAVLAMRDSRTSLKQNENSLQQNELSLDQNALSLKQTEISLKQNEISISQNSTIQKLTYLTIAYLPAGLMASIFNIPDSQKVLHSSMGVSWFVGAILILSVITYIFAFYIMNILVDFVKSLKGKFGGPPVDQSPDNSRSSPSAFRKVFCLPFQAPSSQNEQKPEEDVENQK